MSKKWIVTLFTSVVAGIVLFTAAGCGQGNSGTFSTQPDARPMAGPAQTAQAIQQPRYTVELDIFSGVPNPTWVLGPAEASDLHSRISKLNPTEAGEQRPENLGYRGFIVQISSPSSPTVVQTIRACHGMIQVADSTRTTWYIDPQQQIELWLLATSKAPLGEDLIAEIVKEINAP